MSKFVIRNRRTGKTESLVRDVRHAHSDWVHAQMGTESESELQYVLDNLHADDYAGGAEDQDGIALSQ